MLLHFVYIIIF